MVIKDGNLCVEIYRSMNFGEKQSDISAVTEWLGEEKYFDCWIDGKYKKPEGNIAYSTTSLGDATCLVADGVYDTLHAVTSSIKAQSEWMKWSLLKRVSVLHKILRKLKMKRKLLSNLFELQGQPDDSELFLDYFNFYSNMLNSETNPVKPVGVVLIILSNDAPAWFSAATSAAALWAGCSVIIKPSVKAPFFPFLLAEICSLAGLPNGLINVVPGLRFADLISPVGVDKIVFSDDSFEECGTLVQNDFSLFKFGRTSSIIFDSCDMDEAADKLYSEIGNSSQHRPWKIDLILVQEAVYDVFLKKLTRKMTAINRENKCEFRKLYEDPDFEKILVEAEKVNVNVFVASNDSDSSRILITEYKLDLPETDTFITTLLIFKTAKEAVDIVNNASYCLGTSIWSENMAQSMQVASKLDTSTVWINCHGITNASVPFEVFRRSGTGILGGLEGGLAYTTHETAHTKALGEKDKPIVENVHYRSAKEIAAKSHEVFLKWKCSTNRKELLLNIADEIEKIHISENGGNDLSQIIRFWALNENSYEGTMGTMKDNLYATQCKKPIGVIEMILTNNDDSVETLISWVTPAVAMGNVAIVVLDEILLLRLEPVIQIFIRNLPHGVLEIVRGLSHARQLASDSNIDSVWLNDEDYSMLGQKYSSDKWKRIWAPPSPVPLCKMLVAAHCLKTQAIWFPAINSSN